MPRFKVGDLITPLSNLDSTIYRTANLSCVAGVVYEVLEYRPMRVRFKVHKFDKDCKFINTTYEQFKRQIIGDAYTRPEEWFELYRPMIEEADNKVNVCLFK